MPLSPLSHVRNTISTGQPALQPAESSENPSTARSSLPLVRAAGELTLLHRAANTKQQIFLQKAFATHATTIRKLSNAVNQSEPKMRVVVAGAGVIGVATAYYLARQGHQVSVIDRQAAAGLETSYANAGEVTAGYASPWSGPGMPAKAVKWMLSPNSPIAFHPQMDTQLPQWMWQWWRNCAPERYAENKQQMVKLASYSLEQLQALRHETGIRYDEGSGGTLQLFRTKEQFAAARKDVAIIDALGIRHELVDAEGCIAAEPGLGNSTRPIAGGLRLPSDETGDCFKFTQGLAQLAAQEGVDFHYNTAIHSFVRKGDRIAAVETDTGPHTGDAFVVALGSHSRNLLRPLGMTVPIYPLKGYSLTMPIIDPDRAPRSTILDENSKVAITRMGDRIRAGGFAEIAGFSTTLPAARKRAIGRVVQELFPGATDVDRAEFWTGLRPVTPDGPPLMGETPLRNLYLNTGHGSFGWAMACGSGKMVADLLSKKTPEIDIVPFQLSRYQK